MPKSIKIFLIGFLLVWFTGMILGMSYGVVYEPRTEKIGRYYQYNHDSRSYADIVKVDYKGSLRGNGDLAVIEILHFDIYDANRRPFRELYREFGYSVEDNKRGILPDAETFKVTDITDSANPAEFARASSQGIANRTEGLWDYADAASKTYKELRWFVNFTQAKPVYKIEYIYKNVLDVFQDAVQLDMILFTGGAIGYIQEYDAELIFPSGMTDMESFRYFAHNQPDAAVTKTGDSVKLHADRPRASVNNDLGFLELRAAAGAEALGLFPDATNVRKDYTYRSILQEEWDWEHADELAARRARTETTVDIALAGLTAVLLCCLVLYVKRRLRVPYKPAAVHKYYSKLPKFGPTVAGVLLQCKTGAAPRLLEAAVMSLCRKGFLKVEMLCAGGGWTQDNIGFTTGESLPAPTFKNLKAALQTGVAVWNASPLPPYEEEVLRLFIASGLDSACLLPLTSVFPPYAVGYAPLTRFRHEGERACDKECERSGFFRPVGALTRWFNAFLMPVGIIVGIAACFLCAAYTTTPYGFAWLFPMVLLWGTIITGIGFLSGGHKYVLTQSGADAAAEAAGLYNFLNGLPAIKEAEMPQFGQWEEYLVYATAFGVADKVNKALCVRYPSEFGADGYGTVRHLRRFGSIAAFSGVSRALRSSSAAASRSGLSSSGVSHGGGGGGGRH